MAVGEIATIAAKMAETSAKVAETGKKAVDIGKRLDVSKEVGSVVGKGVDISKRIVPNEIDNVKELSSKDEVKIKTVERGSELTQYQKKELISKGMSPGIVNDCTIKDGVYQLKTTYNKFEGKQLGDTGIKYERKLIDYFGKKLEGVFPKFDALFTAQLPVDMLKASDKKQFSECVTQLKQAIKDNPSLGDKFSQRQLDQIAAGKNPSGYVWHHNEEIGKMELVKCEPHDIAKHTGGRAIWGGGGQAR